MTIDEQSLERKFLALTNSQESVQTLSLWILHHKNHSKKIIQVWYRVLEKDKISHRLTMFYLANDVIQLAKKKGYKQYSDGFKDILKKATALVRDEKIAPKIIRIFKIWSERNIYPDELIDEWKQVLDQSDDQSSNKESSQANNSTTLANRIPVDFSLANLDKKVKDVELSDKQASALVGTLNLNKIEKIDSHILMLLKDKKAGEQCLKELADIENSLKHAVQALEKQVNCRASYIDALDKCELFYETQNSEVKIVANAYKSFSTRVLAVKSRLSSSELSFSSPCPSPPVLDAPSPLSDDDLVLPGHDSPLPGLKSLLNVLNENSSKNKISSLDKRLSSLMQNLPNMKQAQQTAKSDKSNKDKKPTEVWSPTVNSQQQHQPNIQAHQIQHPPPFNPIFAINQPPINQPPPMMNQASMLTVPPVMNLAPLDASSIHHPPPFIPPPHNVAPPMPPVQMQMSRDPNYYPVRFPNQQLSMTNSPQMNSNSMYNGTNSPSVHQIKSVISTRGGEQELIDQSMPYDPYAVNLNDTLADSFCEPADMDIGDSDEEQCEMNRSSNSQRVLKVIETSNDSSNYGGCNKLNTSFNSNHCKSSQAGYNFPTTNLPSSLNNSIPKLPSNLTIVSASGSNNNQMNTPTNSHYSNGKPPQHHHHPNQSNSHHQSGKLYSPAKSFHHKEPYGSNNNSRFNNKNYNNHQLTGPTAQTPYNQAKSSSSNKLDYFDSNPLSGNQSSNYGSQTMANSSNTNAIRKAWSNEWKNQFTKNNHQNHSRNRSFHSKTTNLNNLTSLKSSNMNSNLTNLNQHQYQ